MGTLQIYLSKVKANSQRWQWSDKIIYVKTRNKGEKKPKQTNAKAAIS